MYFFILCTSIICSWNRTIYLPLQPGDNACHIKIEETDGKIVLSWKSKNYFPTLGRWYDGDTLISYKQFYIHDEEVSKWLSENFTDKNILKDFLNNLDSHVFEFKVDKAFLSKNINNLVCKIELIRKDHLEKIMIKYSNDFAKLDDASNSNVLENLFDKVMIKMVDDGFNFNIILGKEIHHMLASSSDVPNVQETTQ
jgi:hypothetical protein